MDYYRMNAIYMYYNIIITSNKQTNKKLMMKKRLDGRKKERKIWKSENIVSVF